jgi:4-hydroxy-3-polyprenylbenzoate decarboxylase
MTYYKDLRAYLRALEEADQLVRIKSLINKDTELMPMVRLQFRGLPEAQRKAFLFENITAVGANTYNSPVAVAALAGSSKIYAIGMMCRPEDIGEKLTQAALHPYEPKLINNAPVQEEIHMGADLLEHGCLEEFPIPISTPGFDPSPAISAPYWVTKDPENGTRNVGIYRMLLKSPTRTGIDFCRPTRGVAVHWNKCRARGIPLQAAVVIGGPPSVGYVAATNYARDTDELAVAGGIAGEPLELVKCKTVDIEVPAHAEIVIEGEVNTQELEPEGPFGESIGVISLTQTRPFFKVKCITHRKNPIWLTFISQFQPSESSKIKYHGNISAAYKHLRYDLGFEKVLKVAMHEMSNSALYTVVQVKNAKDEEVWQILEAIDKFRPETKTIIAVDEDINPDDPEMVIFALSHRFQPHQDARIVTRPAHGVSDCSLAPMEKLEELREAKNPVLPERSLLLINATKNWPYPPASLPTEEFMQKAIALWRKEGLPELQLRDPIWGRIEGYWGEADKKKAKLALKGEYYKTGDVQKKQRVPAGPHFCLFDE